MPSVQRVWPCGADRRQRAERDRVGDAHRREQAEAGLAHVLHFPRAAGRRERGEPAPRRSSAPVGLVAHAPEHRELHRAAEAAGRARAAGRRSCSSSRRKPEILAKPTMASTVPAAAVRSPRRANGLNSGSTCEASLLTAAPSCSLRLRRAFRQRLRPGSSARASTTFCISSACSGRVSRNSTRPSSGAGVRRRRPSRAAEVDVERRHRRRLEREAQRLAPFVELARDPLEVARRQCCRRSSSCSTSTTRYSCSIVVVPAAGVEQQLLALDLARAGEREQRVQLRPLRRNPLLVAVEPDLRVEAQVHDLPRDELGQQLLPLAGPCACATPRARTP